MQTTNGRFQWRKINPPTVGLLLGMQEVTDAQRQKEEKAAQLDGPGGATELSEEVRILP